MAPIDSKAMTQALKRIQRYLGYRREGDVTGIPRAHTMPKFSRPLTRPGPVTEAIDTSQAPPYEFDKRPVFIAVDVEAAMDTGLVTEVGVAILDTSLIRNLPPGIDRETWMGHALCRHFLVAGEDGIFGLYKTNQSGGDPGSFSHGETIECTLAQMDQHIRKQFEEPFDPSITSDLQIRTSRRNLIVVGNEAEEESKSLDQSEFDFRQQYV